MWYFNMLIVIKLVVNCNQVYSFFTNIHVINNHAICVVNIPEHMHEAKHLRMLYENKALAFEG